MAQTEEALLEAARAGGEVEFRALAEPYRRELQAHCYRMVGSLHDAEDLVQETMLRAWRKLDTWEGRATLRAWLYKIATNACLDLLEKRPARSLPTAIGQAADPLVPFAPPTSEPVWLEPFPDAWLTDSPPGPEAVYSSRQSVALAFMVALHKLPARQRAVLILRDVLGWRASEVAELLDLTVAAANSALQRARTTLGAGSEEGAVKPPEDETKRTLLGRYLRAWEDADVTSLVALLREDALLAMPPMPSWYQGSRAIGAFLSASLLGADARGRFRFVPTSANGQPAFGCYQLDPVSGAYQALGIQVLRVEGGRIAEIMSFLDPTLLSRFDLPPTMAGSTPR